MKGEPEHVRFWRHVPERPEDDCWIWTGELNNHGYGIFRTYANYGRKKHMAHRWAKREAMGDSFDESLFVLHQCDNPPCVNPSHMRQGTQLDNVREAIARNRMNMSGLAIGWQLRRDLPKRTCHCGAPASGGRGLCSSHYMIWWRAQKDEEGGTTPRQRARLRKCAA